MSDTPLRSSPPPLAVHQVWVSTTGSTLELTWYKSDTGTFTVMWKLPGVDGFRMAVIDADYLRLFLTTGMGWSLKAKGPPALPAPIVFREGLVLYQETAPTPRYLRIFAASDDKHWLVAEGGNPLYVYSTADLHGRIREGAYVLTPESALEDTLRAANP